MILHIRCQAEFRKVRTEVAEGLTEKVRIPCIEIGECGKDEEALRAVRHARAKSNPIDVHASLDEVMVNLQRAAIGNFQMGLEAPAIAKVWCTEQCNTRNEHTGPVDVPVRSTAPRCDTSKLNLLRATELKVELRLPLRLLSAVNDEPRAVRSESSSV